MLSVSRRRLLVVLLATGLGTGACSPTREARMPAPVSDRASAPAPADTRDSARAVPARKDRDATASMIPRDGPPMAAPAGMSPIELDMQRLENIGPLPSVIDSAALADNGERIDVWVGYATRRNATGRPEPERFYGVEDDVLKYGIARVSINPRTRPGEGSGSG